MGVDLAMESFEQKAMDYYGEIVIDKSFIRQAGFGNRGIPTFVGEWIIGHFMDQEGTETITDAVRQKISDFVTRFMPSKDQKQTVKNKLFQQYDVQLLDNYSVVVDLDRQRRNLVIPYLDIDKATLNPHILEGNPMLLQSGVWGVGTLMYIPQSTGSKKEGGDVMMRKFHEFQTSHVDLASFIEARGNFTTHEWIDLIISSMGFNPNILSLRQKILMLCRLLPLVEPRYCLLELAPKGTGKSFVFDNISRYVTVRTGAITPSILFYHGVAREAGLINRYDCIVLDEAQKLKTDSSGEVGAMLKSYLESGKFTRLGSGTVLAEASLAILANIDLDDNRQPLHYDAGLVRGFPNFVSETAFVDRFTGLLPGWDLPRITADTPSASVGFKGEIFGEVLHSLRLDVSYRNQVKAGIVLENADDMRDRRAIETSSAGLMKIIFPDKKCSDEEFYRYCVNPALELRQRIRDELCKMDMEYRPLQMGTPFPDEFQLQHVMPKYYDAAALQTSEALLQDKADDDGGEFA